MVFHLLVVFPSEPRLVGCGIVKPASRCAEISLSAAINPSAEQIETFSEPTPYSTWRVVSPELL